ncbi:unnamed protein product [Fraxinus pennsylvanica]|uniref:Uncharacterized protein n=1 Tax=Fraxinus pennsylvanica TaxID=56036 RepID=A0AAD2DPF3_9LAMI|nr:unnamed protein product [Fraxinus pennsylvanica]
MRHRYYGGSVKKGRQPLFQLDKNGVRRKGTCILDCSGRTLKDKVEEGKEVVLKLVEPVLLRTKGEGYSGKLEPGKFDPPVGKDALKPIYGICYGEELEDIRDIERKVWKRKP